MNSLSNPSSIIETFTILDDLNALLQLNKQLSGRKPTITLSEAATISLIRSEYGIRTWKGLYKLLKNRFKYEFKLPVYKNFVILMNQDAKLILVLINALLQLNLKQAGVIKLIDSTPIPVCKNYRIKRHKTMRKFASRSKTALGWFYGLKLHALTDISGNLLGIRFTTGKVNDRVILDAFLEKLHNSIVIAPATYLNGWREKRQDKTTFFLPV